MPLSVRLLSHSIKHSARYKLKIVYYIPSLFIAMSFHLPLSATVILLTTLPALFLLALMTGTIHFLRRRTKRKIRAQQQAEVENILKRARRPVLAIDTDVARPNEVQRSASATRCERTNEEGAPPVPVREGLEQSIRGGRRLDNRGFGGGMG
jgi:hypothetical protein